MTSFQSAVAQTPTPPSGKTKWKTNNKQTVQRYNYPPQQIQPLPPPQMFYNAYSASYPDPRNHLVPPYDPYFYATHPTPYYTSAGNLYHRPQIQSPPPPRPYLTITQFNYQPIGYHQTPSSTNLVPPPLDRRCASDTQCNYFAPQYEGSTEPPKIIDHSKLLYHKTVQNCAPNCDDKTCTKRNDLKSDSSSDFEFTIQPEQIVNQLCDDKEVDNHEGSTSYESPRLWTDFMDPMRIEDDDLTKFIVDGCMKAESIAVRNRHRPCFKNIKHLCTRTRTDILKPRTTVANIHSQGIPWATKDFIFAFVRLINCWYILKGYLDDHEGSLGKIDTALTPEFKDCYQRWQSINKEMVKHLINIFVTLDNGITVQNAEIFSSFNNLIVNSTEEIPSQVGGPCENTKIEPVHLNNICHQDSSGFRTENAQCQTDIYKETNIYQETKNYESETAEVKNSYLDERVSIPGILRVKDMFNKCNSEEEQKRGPGGVGYMKPGSYRIPKKSYSEKKDISLNTEESDTTLIPEEAEVKSFSRDELDTQSVSTQTPDDAWKSAIENLGPLIKLVMQDSESIYDSLENEHQIDKDSLQSKSKEYRKIIDTEAWVNEHNFENCIDENIEDVTISGKYKEKRPITNRNGRKNIIIHRTVKKKIDECNSKTNKNKKSIGFLTKRKFGLSSLAIGKFEKIINALWNLQFAKYITFEINAENVPDYYKYINKPMFLCKVMNNLKQDKYLHPHQVVHDLRTIVRNSELYVEKRPDWWFEKCLTSFSLELETQLAEKFSTDDFSLITGDPNQPPRFDTHNNDEQLE